MSKIDFPPHLMSILFFSLFSPVVLAKVSSCERLNSITITSQQSSQIIMVKILDKIHAEISLCKRLRKRWVQELKPSFKAVIGKNGLAAENKKMEGDLKTPAGLYPIGEVFGSKPLAVKMDFKYIIAEDKYIDDVHAPNYNQWIRGKTKARSYENMLYKFYEYGLVINYNKNPTKAGAGSAIFMHLWKSPSTPTHGCIATDKKHLLALVNWLDQKQNPYIFIY
ncbi:MAG: L,D-transpeptidase family protein [Tatlockia sp.]|nr:L,D-transpeptidase family protein [Tatlockia sp.]